MSACVKTGIPSKMVHKRVGPLGQAFLSTCPYPPLLPHLPLGSEPRIIPGEGQYKGTFHLSELTGQTIPVEMRISLLIKTIQPDQPNPTVKIVCTKKMVFSCGFSANTLWKKPISFANWLVQQWSSRPFLTNGKRPQCQNGPQLQNFFRKTALDTGYSVLEWTREKFITAGGALTFGVRCERVWSRKKSVLLRQQFFTKLER